MKVSVVILLLVFSSLCCALKSIPIHPDETYQLVDGVEFLIDETNSLEIPNIQSNLKWQAVDRRNINFGFIENTLWLRFKVVAQVDSDWVLYISYPLIDHLESTSIINGQLGKTIVTGDQVKFSSRAMNNPAFSFPYSLSRSDVLEVYFKVNTLGAAEVPFNLMSHERYLNEEVVRNSLWGLINGIYIIMFLYNLFIYFVVREKVYIYYVLCVFTNFMFLGVYNGNWFQYVWPEFPGLNHPIFAFLNGFMYFVTLLFVTEFLQIFTRKSWYRHYFKYLLIFLATLPILSLFMAYKTIVLIEVISALVMNVSGIAIGVYLSFKGESLAKLFTLAWCMFLVGLMCANLKSFGLLPSNWFTIYAYQFGSFIELTLLSMALAYRIESANKEKSKAQKENIQTLKRYQKLYSGSLSGQFQLGVDGQLINVNPAFYKMLGYSSESDLMSLTKSVRNERLSIDEETYERLLVRLENSTDKVSFESKLSEKNKDKKWFSITMEGIRDEIGNVKYYEGSMIGINEIKENERIEIESVKDKMVAMEHLVIGICHEMNTPLGVATTGLSYLIKGSEELSNIFKSGELTKKKFTELLGSSNEAVLLIDANLNRLNVIIRKFRNISILQSDYELMEFNVKSVIEEQVFQLTNGLMNHTVKINCPDDLSGKSYPKALADMLNQIIENSIRHGFSGVESGGITISVMADDNDIVIVYKDNGVGIASEKHKEIFNPFYTTQRGSNENIGLGMFQVYNIATQLLKGHISISNVAEGFELVIRFPMKGISN